MEKQQDERLSQEMQQAIDVWVAKYPVDQKQSAIIPALTLVQDANRGSLTQELIDAVADYLEMPRIAAYEVATFYSMFQLKPVGEFVINVCTNISCMLCGSDDVVARLEERLGIKLGETSSDGKYTLREVECLAACVDAPVMEIGKKYYEKLTPEKVDEVLTEIEK